MSTIRIVSVAVIASVLTSLATAGIVLRWQGDAPANTSVPVMDRSGAVFEEDANIVSTVAQVEDAVVSVIITKDLPVIERYYERGGFDDPFGFFGDDFNVLIPRYRENGTQEQEVGGGTAFFISSDGLLLTNKHVVSDEEAEYTVLFNDGERLDARVVARHPTNDIALLKVEGDDFPYLRLSEDEPMLGQSVIVIGNALGEYRNTVSRGVVSGLSRSLIAGDGRGMTEQLDHIIQTDAAINRGNSGGPLLSLNGEVIGMSTAVAEGAQNIGFAIPAADLGAALLSYREHGKIVRVYLGVRYALVTPELQQEQDLPYDYGALLVRGETDAEGAIVSGSPAEKAGLEEGDILLEADGERLTVDRTLASVIRRKQAGDTLRLKVWSAGQEKMIDVVLEVQE